MTTPAIPSSEGTKRLDPSTPPFLSWCLIVRNSERTLEATLRSLRERTPDAEIVVVDTMSSDSSPAIAQKYADVWVEWTGPRGDWNREMPWFDDAAAAREKSFALASGRWRAWCDSDDCIPGPDEVKRILTLNNRFCPTPGNATGSPDEVVGLEDLIRRVEDLHPTAECIYAPYLYQRDKDDAALVWQTRERIVRWSNPPKWRWAEAAHEILVPIDPGHTPPAIQFPHLLFLHEREHSEAANKYAIARHFDVLHRLYARNGKNERGEPDRTTRRCLYLSEYAKYICPEREWEFIQAGHDAAVMHIDRYRALVSKGIHWASRGLMNDALEAFGAATHLRPDLPDAWLAGGDVWSNTAKDPIRAVDWYTKGLACAVGHMESYVNPRFQVIRYPTLLALEWQKLARLQRDAGRQEDAAASLHLAASLLEKVEKDPAIGGDWQEARVRYIRMHNEALAQTHAIQFGQLARYLFDNDESAKVVDLLRVVPWNLADHPIVRAIEDKVRPIVRHMEDPDAYQEFYVTDAMTGFMYSPDAWVGEDPEQYLGRTRWAAAYINQYCPTGTVIDVGCFDGIIGMGLLRLCPGITYIGMDPIPKALDKFKERLAAAGFENRATLHRADTIDDLPPEALGRADVAIWFEVIEHVPDPAATLDGIKRDLIRADGHILVTTPWGSFDCGHPPAATAHGTPRDSRGHLRAMTVPDVLGVAAECSGLVVDDIYQEPAILSHTGDEMRIALRKDRPAAAAKDTKPAVHVAVAGALWDWNSRVVHRDGIGASEETIVYLGKALAVDQYVTVFGPVPEPEVHAGVAYLPFAAIRHIPPSGKILVSRSPGLAASLDTLIGATLPKVLWLQDAYYPDLNPETAARYETIVVVSEWHSLAMHELHGVPLEQMVAIPNFVLAEHFRGKNAEGVVRKKDHFIYASSPDRGVNRLLELWPQIRERLPNATLDIFYGWKGCEKLGLGAGGARWTQRYEAARKKYELIRHQPGVRAHGMINHELIARAFLGSGVWAYPSGDRENGTFSETCLHPDTLISVPGDHTQGGPVRVRIADLEGKSGVPVYSFDEQKQRFCISTMARCWQTKIAEEMIEVELDDGSLLRATPEHLIMNLDREWVAAGDIKAGHRLMPLHFRYNVMIKDADGRWQGESRLVGEWMTGRALIPGEHVDHLDETRRDNRPEALQVLSAADHFRKTHAGKRQRKGIGEKARMWQADPANAAQLAEQNRHGGTETQRLFNLLPKDERDRIIAARAAKHSETHKRLMQDPAYAAEASARARKSANKVMLSFEGREMCLSDWAREKHISSELLSYRLRAGWPVERALATAVNSRNHRVVAVRRIAGGPVFDMEVEGTHTFVAEGVVVHNCCTNAIKARVAGCVPVCPPTAALAETAATEWGVGFADPNDDRAFVDACVEATEVSDQERKCMGDEAMDAYELGVLLPKWKAILQ